MAEATPPLFVFVHGFRDRPEAWAPVIQSMRLTEDKALTVGLKSAATTQSGLRALDAYAQQVIEAIAEHRKDRRAAPLILVGHSMGAQIAELAAAETGAAGLVLITPANLAGHTLSDEVLGRFKAGCAEDRAEMIANVRKALSVDLSEEALAIMVRGAQATSADFALEQLAAWTGGHTAGAHASQVRCPVLVLTTSDDPFFTKTSVEATVAPRFSNVTTGTIEAAGHWPHLERPFDVTDRLAEFAARL